MTTASGQSVLVGRRAEMEAIDRMLMDARDGMSRVLVLRGEAGMGKSALLAYASKRADEITVLRATGIQSEAEFAFAGLHQLLLPVLNRIERLPEPQAAPLRAAFALSEGAADDRFRVALAVLGLLCEVAEERPALCLIDDVQWLDSSSTDALVFVARRLQAEGLVLLFAARDGDGHRFDARGLDELELDGLSPAEAATLINEKHGEVAPDVCHRLVEQAAGNALALLELPTALSKDQLSGTEPLPDVLPLTQDIERLFLERVRRLPDATQRILLLLALDESMTLGPLLRAAEAGGIDPAALAPAEAVGLVRVFGSRVEVRHPLVRSAIYHGTPSGVRRTAHLALADACMGELEAEQRAWHRAAAATEPDRSVADELERTAERARVRGGYGAAATALVRAADLSPDVNARVRRLTAGAAAAWHAGQPERATALLDAAAPLLSDPLLCADVDHLRGEIAMRRGDLVEASEALLRGASAIAHLDPRKALEMYYDAAHAGVDSGDYARVAEAGRRAAALPSDASAEDGMLANLLVGVGSLIEGKTVSEIPLVVDVLARAGDLTEPQLLVWAAVGAGAVGEEARSTALLHRAATLARASGAVDALTFVLTALAVEGIVSGRYAVEAEAAEGLKLSRAAGMPNAASVYLAVLAWLAAVKGRDEECRTLAREALAPARENRLGLAASLAEWALSLLDLGKGRPDDAIPRLEALRVAAPGFGHPYVVLTSTCDLVEACVRADRVAEGHDAYAALDGFARREAPRWALAAAARCRALLAPDAATAEHEYTTALKLHETMNRPFDRARIELLFGEQLRRERRRADSRIHLRAALETFETLDAVPWAERSASELRATGETARKRDPSTLGQLTPQEFQIARLVGEGASNKEVAAQLFLSPRTVEYHLRKVFMKLGIASRAELIRHGVGADLVVAS